MSRPSLSEIYTSKIKPLFKKISPLLELLKPIIEPIENFVFSKNRADILVGIKIGHANVVAVEVERKPAEFKILRFDARPIPNDAKNYGDIIRDVFAGENFTKDFINTSISGNDVIIRFIHYPMMHKKELRESLEYEAEKYIPFNLSDVFIDYEILEEKKEDSKKVYSLALVAAKKDAINAVHSNFKDAGLSLNAIDVDSFAATNLFKIANPEEFKKTVALINIGSELTNITIIHKGHPVFTRDLVFGGKDVTKKIAKIMSMDMEKATEFKLNIDVNIVENKKVLRECLTYLIDEIKLSFNYFANQTGAEDIVSLIYLLGGSSKLNGLSEIFKDELGAEAKYFDPISAFTVGEDVDLKKLEEYSGSLSVPLGLAIR